MAIDYVAFDLETHLINKETAKPPKPVCLAWCGTDSTNVVGRGVVSNVTASDPFTSRRGDGVFLAAKYLLEGAVEGKWRLILQNGKFDLTVLHYHYPDLRPLIFEALERETIHDTLLREKLLELSTSGRVDGRPYSLETLIKKYGGKDIGHFKKGPDIWRLNYSLLDGMPVEYWRGNKFLTANGYELDGKVAYSYAVNDVVDTLAVFMGQERIRQPSGYGSANTEGRQVKTDFCLELFKIEGMKVCQTTVRQFAKHVDDYLEPTKRRLVEQEFATQTMQRTDTISKAITEAEKILTDPAELQKKIAYYKKRMEKDGPIDEKTLEEVIRKKYQDKLLSKTKVLKKHSKLNESGGKFSKNQKKFKEYLIENYHDYLNFTPKGISNALKETGAGTIDEILDTYLRLRDLGGTINWRTREKDSITKKRKHKGETTTKRVERNNVFDAPRLKEVLASALATDSEALDGYPDDEIIRLRKDMTLYSKYKETYVPAMLEKAEVHFGYSLPKETGRTSSFVQIFPREGGVRENFIPDENCLFVDVDWTAIEIFATGNSMVEIFGSSELADYLNQGDVPPDPHAPMGYAMMKSSYGERIHNFNLKFLADEFTKFTELKNSGDAFVKEMREKGKAPGLSYFGGVGEHRLSQMSNAKGIPLTVEEALTARKMHARLFPDIIRYTGYKAMRDDLDWADENGWIYNQGTKYSLDGMPIRFAYEFDGRYRNNCTYCSCLNGRAMQTPAAEGAKEAIFLVTRACYDPTQKSILFGCRPKAFIHDQILLQIPNESEELNYRRGAETSRLMNRGMRRILKHVRVCCEFEIKTRWTKANKEYILGGGKVWENMDFTVAGSINGKQYGFVGGCLQSK